MNVFNKKEYDLDDTSSFVIIHLKNINSWTHQTLSEQNAAYFLTAKSLLMNVFGKYEDSIHDTIKSLKQVTQIKQNRDSYLIYYYDQNAMMLPELITQWFDILYITIDKQTRGITLDAKPQYKLEKNCSPISALSQYQERLICAIYDLHRNRKVKYWRW